MTKEARPAKPVRATTDEWSEIDKAAKRAGKDRSTFVRDAALGVARGTLVEKTAKRTTAAPSGVKPVTPQVSFNRATSLGGPPRPVKPLPDRRRTT